MPEFFGFDEQSITRIREAVMFVEKQYDNPPAKRASSDHRMRFHVRGLLLAELERGSLETPDTAAMAVYIAGDSGWEDNGEEITIYETGMLPADVTLPAGCQVEASFEGGVWVLSAYDCDLEDVS